MLTEELQEATRPLLRQGFISVAAFGRLDASRAAIVTLALCDSLVSALNPLSGMLKSKMRITRATRIRIVDENRRQVRIRVQIRRQSTQIPTIAIRTQWQ